MEGVSFLTGRLRQKIDDEYPEITHGLTQRLWANYLRPTPSMSIVQFEPLIKPGPARHVPRHCEIQSNPIQGVQCRFRTVFDTEVLPLKLEHFELADTGNGAVLTLGLNLTADGHLGELNLQRLRLHLAGSTAASNALYLAMMRHLRAVRVTLLKNNDKALLDASGQAVQLKIDPTLIRSVGFADDEALVPHTNATYSGYQLLQEFFVFRAKFLFVDVLGLEQINGVQTDLLTRACGFQLRFEFNRFLRHIPRPTIDNIKLYCTPISNLFSHQAYPVTLEAGQQEYPLLPREMSAEHCEVFSVDRVRGSQPSGKDHREYLPYESTTPGSISSAPSSTARYSLNHRQSVLSDSLLTAIRFEAAKVADETIAIDLTCTNRNLPRQLKEADICRRGAGIPGLMTFKNIIPATPDYAPPAQGDYLWRLISNMSLNYLSLADVDALKEILQAYDLPAFHDREAQRASEHLFAALQSVSHQNIDYLMLGRPVRGIRTRLHITPQDAQQEDQWFLLGNVLDHFFALYVSAHSFNQLQITSSSGESWLWPARPGQTLTL